MNRYGDLIGGVSNYWIIEDYNQKNTQKRKSNKRSLMNAFNEKKD